MNGLCDGHRAIEFKSKGTCRDCNVKHCSSICYESVEQQPSVVESHQKQPVMTRKVRDLIYPAAVDLVDDSNLEF